MHSKAENRVIQTGDTSGVSRQPGHGSRVWVAIVASLIGAGLVPNLAAPARGASETTRQVEPAVGTAANGGVDRLERQRAFARRDLPLPGTPDPTRFDQRLASHGLKLGDPVLIRIFKASSELELWMQRGEAFVHFATYPICQWSGVLGPKFFEGDNQSPEGFYAVSKPDLKRHTRHHRAFNIGFPNGFDRANDRTGSNILVHGGCSTEGCFAMTNPVIEEIFKLGSAALEAGQPAFQVQVFPFRMDAATLAQHANSPWLPFWLNLKPGYDQFEQSRVPPAIAACHDGYRFGDVGTDAQACQNPVAQGPAAADRPAAAPDATALPAQAPELANAIAAFRALAGMRLAIKGDRTRPRAERIGQLVEIARTEKVTGKLTGLAPMGLGAGVITSVPGVPASVAPPVQAALRSASAAGGNCNINLPSCRRWLALHARNGMTKVQTAKAAKRAKVAGSR